VAATRASQSPKRLRTLDQVADRHVGARARELDGDAAPDAARSARDDGDLAFEQG
jgi:hypothetical protein